MTHTACDCRGGQLQWRADFSQCPFSRRPYDLKVDSGTTIRLRKSARMWTGKLGDPSSELHRACGLEDLEFKVCQAHRTANHIQVRAKDFKAPS